MTETIKQILMRRDNMSEEAAINLIDEAIEALEALDETDIFAAEDICAEYFGLEPDYLMELIDLSQTDSHRSV